MKKRARDSADQWFSRYIRVKHHHDILPDGTALCKCYITGQVNQARYMDCGHAFSRSHKSTRYDEDNCRPQSRKSNRFSTDEKKFKELLRKELGDKKFHALERRKNSIGEDNLNFLRATAKKYRDLTNEYATAYNIKKWW